VYGAGKTHYAGALQEGTKVERLPGCGGDEDVIQRDEVRQEAWLDSFHTLPSYESKKSAGKKMYYTGIMKLESGGAMRRLILALVAVCVALVAGCAIMPPGARYTYEAPPAITPDASSGVIYFLRESAFVGGGGGYFIYENGKAIGLLASGTYFIHKSIPGSHIYTAGEDARSAITLDVHAGQTYYIISWVSTPGILGAAPLNLKEIPRPVAEKALPNLKYIRMIGE